MNSLKEKLEQKGGDWQEELKISLAGTTVVTR